MRKTVTCLQHYPCIALSMISFPFTRKQKRCNPFLVLGTCCLLAAYLHTLPLHAQVYRTAGKHRYSFAQTTFGYEMEYTPPTGYSYYRNAQQQLEKIPIGNALSPTVSITGLHFWGRAEFFTSFSLPDINLGRNKNAGRYQRFGATGFKVFVPAVQINKPSPFVGMSLASFAYKQSDGTTMKRADGSLLFGLTYSFRKGLLEIGGSYHYANKQRYFISPNEVVQMRIPALSVSADFKYFFDLSISSWQREKNGELKQEFDLLRKKHALNSLSIGLGPSYSFFTRRSDYNRKTKPFLDDHRVTTLYPDLGIGYYHYKLDATANLSWRAFRSRLSAYGSIQELRRHSFALELYKFLGDYHGFVPFAGGVLSLEQSRVREFEQGRLVLNRSHQYLSPGIIAGWDIRPTRTDWWGVRTNIRWFPFLKLDMPGESTINMQQVELNFLQMILYPNRIIARSQKKKRANTSNNE